MVLKFGLVMWVCYLLQKVTTQGPKIEIYFVYAAAQSSRFWSTELEQKEKDGPMDWIDQ